MPAGLGRSHEVPDGGGLTARARSRREQVRLQAAQMFAQDTDARQIARSLRVSTKSVDAGPGSRRWYQVVRRGVHAAGRVVPAAPSGVHSPGRGAPGCGAGRGRDRRVAQPGVGEGARLAAATGARGLLPGTSPGRHCSQTGLTLDSQPP
jgi:hypothetical protein